MFQNNNAAREIFYIFLWLIGIILFYALVHTFLLEPSLCKSSHEKHLQATSTHKKETKSETKPLVNSVTTTVSAQHIKKSKPTPIKPHAVIKTLNTPVDLQKIPAQPSKIVESVLTKVSVPIKPLDVPTQIKKSSSQDVEITITSVPSVPKIPTVPTIPTISTPVDTMQVPQVNQAVSTYNQTVTMKKKSTTQKVEEDVQEKDMPKIKKTYDRDEQIKLLDTARKHIIEKVEAARETAMKNLTK